MVNRPRSHSLDMVIRAQQAKKKKNRSTSQKGISLVPLRPSLAQYPQSTLSELLEYGRKSLISLLDNETASSDEYSLPSNPLNLFFSFTDATKRAHVVNFRGENLDDVWAQLTAWLSRQFKSSPLIRWLRVDWVTETHPMSWNECMQTIQRSKRNYFRYGIALDSEFHEAFLEQELNANAMLYLGGKTANAGLNVNNFTRYAQMRYGKNFQLPQDANRRVQLFTTQAIFLQSNQNPVLLHGYSGGSEGRDTGRRIIERLDAPQVKALIEQSSQFLAEQVSHHGRFIYGLHPCFDREIKSYNSLRHASTTYAMLEAWEVTKDVELKAAIDRSLGYLTKTLIRCYTCEKGNLLAYLQGENNEIKLGGNAVCLLVLVKYTELTDDNQYLPLMEKLALGIQMMQNPATGQFVHVLNADDLSVKETFRIIYYDGEAAFGLMRLYGLTEDLRWLQTVEKGFEYFIAQQHWKIHDHWLSYCVNELTLYRPEECYYQFGIQNVAGYLDFVIERITTFPTLLELMMAAHKMITRLDRSEEHRHLLKQIDLPKFYRALETRAHHLLNGFFWPEFAMYFKNPQRILGSFFIRHHSFRVRIDDVEHYLSGYIAFLKSFLDSSTEERTKLKSINSLELESVRSDSTDFLRAETAPVITRKSVDPTIESRRILKTFKKVEDFSTNWTAHRIAEACPGKWQVPPVSSSWQATGVSFTPVTMQPGHLVVVRSEGGVRGILPERVTLLPFTPQGIIFQPPLPLGLPQDIPLYQVVDTGEAVMALGRYARKQMTGCLVGVTGSAGKTSSVTMFQAMLNHWGQTGATTHSANLPLGIAWTLASLPWKAPYQVIEMAIGRMPNNSALVCPDVAVFLNVGPAHLEYHKTTENIARKKSSIFESMKPGSHAVINRDMEEFSIVEAAARQRRLEVITFGCHPQSDIRWLGYSQSSFADFVTVDLVGERLEIPSYDRGPHWVMNVMAGLGVLVSLGLPPSHILPFLDQIAPPAGRGQRFDVAHPSGEGNITIVDDAYNANPLSMKAMLIEFSGLEAAGRKHLVLGDMLELGSDSPGYHAELVPWIIKSGARNVWLLGEEMPKLVDLLRNEVARVECFNDAEDLFSAIVADFMPGDLVVFKSSNKIGLSRMVKRLLKEWGD